MSFWKNTVQYLALSEFFTAPKALIIKNKATSYGLNSPEYTSNWKLKKMF